MLKSFGYAFSIAQDGRKRKPEADGPRAPSVYKCDGLTAANVPFPAHTYLTNPQNPYIIVTYKFFPNQKGSEKEEYAEPAVREEMS